MPSGSRFAKIATLASAGFLTMRLVIDVFVRQVGLQNFHYPHFAGTVILFLVWVLAGSRAFSDKGLRGLDAAGTIAASLGYVGMVLTMPPSWRADQLVLLILNAVLLGRAALVPSEPRRTVWISAASVSTLPIATFLVFRNDASQEISAGAIVIQVLLWAAFTVIVATLISNVTFHLRRSGARARAGSVSTTCLRRSAKAAWASSIARSTRCCGGRRRSSCCRRTAPGK